MEMHAMANGEGGEDYGRAVIDINEGKGLAEYEMIHGRIAQLAHDQNRELQNPNLTDAQIYQIRQEYYLKQQNELNKLPPHEKARYQYEQARSPSNRPRQSLNRMGTRRLNMNNEQEIIHRPYFIITMFIVNVVMFVIEMYVAEWEFVSTEENPLIGPDAKTLLDLGAQNGDRIQDGDWWRLFTPLVLHAGVIHLLMNMFVLMRLGYSMEQAFGFWRVACIYTFSGVFGVMFSAIMNPGILSVGASSALFGLIGALFGDFIQNHKFIMEGKWSYFAQLVFSSLIGLAIGLFPLLDNFGHFGGWVYGIFAGITFLSGTVKDEQGKAVKTWYNTPLALLGFVAQIALGILGVALLYSEDRASEWCDWCNNISCVETPWWDCIEQQCTTYSNGTTICAASDS